MNVSRPVAIVMCFMVSVIAGFVSGVVAAFLGVGVPTSVAWGGGGFIGFATLGLMALTYLSADREASGPPAGESQGAGGARSRPVRQRG
ncbi:hypothetical protein ADK34_18760 [Streptomyces viridochromogenes]|uniref:Uncharacterized protein n=1 Tax=Streptomyces viridochromogenes TaxID=1938 RepID=A0A0L8KF20_STRVR|nr:hypothetical protein [Streptomyces wedmorensis]KOG24461.1 hypothetical protein ADK34_18760 [Streptomyces viridochromogenes]